MSTQHDLPKDGRYQVIRGLLSHFVSQDQGLASEPVPVNFQWNVGSEPVPLNIYWTFFFNALAAVPVAAAPTAGIQHRAHRETEIRWREGHPETLRQYAGSWVALEGERILAHGTDPSAVAEEARRSGVAVPYIFRVEQVPEKDVVLMGL